MRYLVGVAVCAALVACSGTAGAPDAQQVIPDGPSDAEIPTPVVDPLLSTITVDRAQAAAGIEQVMVTVTVRAPAGAPIVGAPVQLTASGSSYTFSPPGLTDTAGRITAMFSSTVAEAKTVSALVSGVTINGPSVTFIAGPVAMLGFGQQPTEVVAGAPFMPAVRVESQDAFGNPVDTGTGYAILSLGANPGSTSLRGTTVLMLQNGSATFAATHIDVAGTGYSLRVQSSTGLASSTSSSFDVTSGLPDAAHSTLVAIPHSLEANGIDTTQVTFHVANTYGVAIAGGTVSLAVSGSNNCSHRRAG